MSNGANVIKIFGFIQSNTGYLIGQDSLIFDVYKKRIGKWAWHIDRWGSLTSCPGQKIATAAAMGDSGYHKTGHVVHLLSLFHRHRKVYIAIFFSLLPNEVEIE